MLRTRYTDEQHADAETVHIYGMPTMPWACDSLFGVASPQLRSEEALRQATLICGDLSVRRHTRYY